MAESSIKIEITGEAAIALAKLPELLQGAIRLNYEKDQEREDRRDRREAEIALEERLREERRAEREASAASDRMDRIVNILTILGNAAEAYFGFASKDRGDKPEKPAPEKPAEDPTLLQLRNELLRVAPPTKNGIVAMDELLQILKHDRPEWLPSENVGRILAIMQNCTDLRDAGDLLDALGEDTEVHREAIKVLDAAFDMARGRADPGFMCMDCGARQVDPKTHHKECKEHEDKLEPGHEDRPVSSIDFVTAVCSLVGLDLNGSLHLTEALTLALKTMSEWDGPLAWDYPDCKFTGPLRSIDRYLSNPAPKHIREVLDRKDLSTGMDWLKEAALRLRHMEGDNIDYVDADMRFISSVCRLAGLSGVAPDSLEGALRLLSTSIKPPTDPEPPTNLERVAEYLNARQYHPSITGLLLRPDFKVAYERLKGIAAASTLEVESA